MEARQGRDAYGGSVRSTTARPGLGRVTPRPGPDPITKPWGGIDENEPDLGHERG